MSYLRIPQGDYDILLVMDPKVTQVNIIDYVVFLRKSKSSASVMIYLSAIGKFYMMNDILRIGIVYITIKENTGRLQKIDLIRTQKFSK